MSDIISNFHTKVATMALPTRDTFVNASVWQRSFGTILYVSEFNLNSSLAQEFTQALTSTLSYSPILEGVGKNTDPAEILQDLLLEANKVLEPRRRLFGNPLAPRYHLALAIIKGSDLAVAGVGHMNALMVSSPTQVSNLFTATAPGKKQHESIFKYIVTGKLEPQETFLLSGNAIFDYVSLEKISTLCAEHKPGIALREIENVITTPHHHPPLAIIALRLELPTSGSAPIDSLQRLTLTKNTVNQVLRPSFRGVLQNVLLKIQTTKLLTGKENNSTNSASSINKRSSLHMLGKQRVVALLIKINKFKAWLGKCKDHEYRRFIISNKFEQGVNGWYQLRIYKRILFLVAFTALIIFSQSVVSGGWRRIVDEESRAYNTLITKIIENHALVESALLYHDTIKSRSLLNETADILAMLPRNTSERAWRFDNFFNKQNELNERIFQSFTVNNFPLLVDLDKNKNWKQLVRVGKRLYATSLSGEIFMITSSKVEQIFKISVDDGVIKNVYSSDEEILIDTDKSQTLFHPVTRIISKISPPIIFKDISIYDGKWYYLGEKPYGIYRAIINNGKFVSQTAWLKSGQEESAINATSLAVDGTVYTIINGIIKKFLRGNLQTSNYELSKFKFTADSLIRVIPGTDYIYVYSTADKYFVLYNSQGVILTQLNLSAINQINDLAVSEGGQELYILDANHVYKLRLADYILK